MVNEAAIRAASTEKALVTVEELDFSLQRVLAGTLHSFESTFYPIEVLDKILSAVCDITEYYVGIESEFLVKWNI